MLQGYHKLLKTQALKQLNKLVYIPEASLGVGDAEYSGSVGVKPNYQQPVRQAKVKDVQTTEDTINLGNGKQFYSDQFPKEFYLGEGVS